MIQSLFKLLRPAPFVKSIEDDALIKKKYKYWQWRTFYSMYIGYAFYYFTRKSFVFVMPFMLNEGFSLSELGMLSSILSLTYGVSKFVSGIMGDRSSPRYFMAFGLILTGIFNIAFGLSSTWILLALFWGLNAWFQGWGWPGCAKLLTHWYSQSERGRWWSVWNTSHNLGGALVPLVVAFVAQRWGWRYGMLFPGALCIGVGFFLINRLRDIPRSLGLPAIEDFAGEKADAQENTRRHFLPIKEILFKHVFCNKYIWIMSFAYFFVYIIRIGFNDWSMLYLINAKGYSTFAAAACILWFEIGGFLGSICAGWCSDKFFRGKRNPINVLFTLGAVCVLVLMRFGCSLCFGLTEILSFLVGFFIFAPQMMIGMLVAELPDKRTAATSSGFAGCFSYLGAAIAGGPLGAFIEYQGWNGLFLVFIGSGIFALILMTPCWSITRASTSRSNG